MNANHGNREFVGIDGQIGLQGTCDVRKYFRSQGIHEGNGSGRRDRQLQGSEIPVAVVMVVPSKLGM